MREDDERDDGGIGLGRTLALSDGIFAIAMTLVAFQVQLPTGSRPLTRKLESLGDSYLVYFISFAVIGLLWLAHHRLFRSIERADESLMILNLAFLMTVAALPFPCSVLGRYGSHTAAVVLYASAMAVAGSLLAALTLVAHWRRLVKPTATRDGFRAGLWRSGSMVATFLISIPVAFVAPNVAPYLWIVLMPARFLTPRSRSGTRRRTDQASTNRP
jgi:uncharacterized membrane protein